MADLIIATQECSINKIVSVLTNCSSAGVLYDEWSGVARNLKVPEFEIRRLALSFTVSTFPDALTEVLQNWKSRQGSSARLDLLITAFEECHLQDCADSLRTEFQSRIRRLAPFQKYVRCPAGVDSFLKGEDQILIIQTLDSKITLQKMWDTVAVSSQFIATTEEDIQNEKFGMENNLSWSDCCILKCTSNVTEIIPILLEFPSRSILIIEENLDDVEKVLSGFYGVSSSQDNPLWSDLSPGFQRKILNRRFCGHMNLTQVTKLCKCSPESILTKEILVDVINNRIPNTFQHLLPARIGYHVERKISPNNIISPKLFESSASEVFVFKDTERDTLSNLPDNQFTDRSGNQLKQFHVPAKYILLDDPTHFDKLCSNLKQPVHLIQFKMGHFIWIKSKGGIGKVQSAATSTTDLIYSETDFLAHMDLTEPIDSSTSPVVISDSPGMGKSVLLAELGRKLFLKCSNRLIIFIVIDELIKSLKKFINGSKLEKTVLEESLVQKACEYEWQVLFFRQVLQNGSAKIELMLDGFDELQTEDLELAYNCFNLIRESYQSVRLWVATRPHHLHALESSLQVLGNNLVPFDIADQKNFFISYWSQGRLLDCQKLAEFSNHCLTTLKRNIKSSDEDIAGIPLQCLLIAEVYEKDAVKFSSTQNSTSNLHFLTLEVNSITDLYERMIEIKFKKFIINYKQNGNVEHLGHMHVYLSLELVFPVWAEVFRNRLQIGSDASLQQVFNAGILESRSTIQVPRFLHRTFAEYFIAWYIVYAIGQKRDTDLTSFLFQHIFAKENVRVAINGVNLAHLNSQTFKYNVICFFANSLISKLGITLRRTNGWDRFGFAEMNSIASCSIHDDLETIFKSFDDVGAFKSHGKMIFDANLLLLSVRRSSIFLIHEICQLFEKFQRTKVNTVFVGDARTSMLQVAVETRDASVVDFLLHKHDFRMLLVKSKTPVTKELLHFCLINSENNDEFLLNEKSQIVKMLIQINKKLLEERNEHGETPLLQCYVHIRLLLLLIEEGADVFARNTREENVLHRAAKYLSSEDYLKLVSSIPGKTLRKLVCMLDNYNCSPLHAIFKSKSPPDPGTIQLIDSAGADFNAVSKLPGQSSGETVLATAVKHNHGVGQIKRLISYGANLNMTTDKGATLLHIAANAGQLNHVRLFLNLGIDVNSEDNQGLTPLNWALNKYDRKPICDTEICMHLHDQGGVLKNQVHKDGKSILHLHVQNLNVSPVRFLVENVKVDVNAIDSSENTPLHCLFGRDRCYGDNPSENDIYEICKILVENGADVNALNEMKRTPLELLLWNGPLTFPIFSLFERHGGISTPKIVNQCLKVFVTTCVNVKKSEFKETVKLLQNLGAKLEFGQNKENGYTLLHQAAESGCVKGFRYLVENGININARNGYMQTPLHLVNPTSNELRIKTVQLLLNLNAQPNVLDSRGETPAHKAIIRNHLPTVELLIETNAYEDFLTGELITYGIKNCNLSIVKYLCELYLTRVGKPLSDIQVNSGDKSVLHTAAARGNLEIMSYLLESEDVIKSLQRMPRMADLLHICLEDTYEKIRYSIPYGRRN